MKIQSALKFNLDVALRIALFSAVSTVAIGCGKLDTNIAELQKRRSVTLSAPFTFEICEGSSTVAPVSASYSASINQVGGNLRLVSTSSSYELSNGGWDL
jgi:adenylosuccinate lyase